MKSYRINFEHVSLTTHNLPFTLRIVMSESAHFRVSQNPSVSNLVYLLIGKINIMRLAYDVR